RLNGTGANLGAHEFLHVGGVQNDFVYFTTEKTKFYGNAAGSDATFGTVMLVRVPNYNNVNVAGTLTTTAFNGSRYGVIAFRVKGELTGNGTISANSAGFNNGAGYGVGNTGNGGGGGSYGTQGTNGGGSAGSTYGNPALATVFLGSSGGNASYVVYESGCGPGGSIPCDQPLYGPLGARGGGIIWIAGQTINFTGSITSNGEGSRAPTVTYDIDGQPVYS